MAKAHKRAALDAQKTKDRAREKVSELVKHRKAAEILKMKDK